MIEELKVQIIGESPLMMHNAQMANPRNEYAKAMKEISSKRKKTEEDLEELARIEWLGGLYLYEGKPAIPADVILATLINAGKKNKLGKQIALSVFEASPWYPLLYDGPKDIDKLYEDGRFQDYRSVRVQMSRVMRSRPIFREWGLAAAVKVNTNLINISDVIEAFHIAGEQIGFLDYRPRYGRFRVEV